MYHGYLNFLFTSSKLLISAWSNGIYCDILAEQITPVWQKYTRLSDTAYHYENVPNDFEATIEVDEFGLVVDYPELFVRTAATTTSY